MNCNPCSVSADEAYYWVALITALLQLWSCNQHVHESADSCPQCNLVQAPRRQEGQRFWSGPYIWQDGHIHEKGGHVDQFVSPLVVKCYVHANVHLELWRNRVRRRAVQTQVRRPETQTETSAALGLTRRSSQAAVKLLGITACLTCNAFQRNKCIRDVAVEKSSSFNFPGPHSTHVYTHMLFLSTEVFFMVSVRARCCC